MGNKKKQKSEYDDYFDDDFEVVYEDLDDLDGHIMDDKLDHFENYDNYNGDTGYYDDYDDDYDDNYDDDNYDDNYNDDYDDSRNNRAKRGGKNSKGKNSKDQKQQNRQDSDSKNAKKKKRSRGLPNVGKPVAGIAKTGINATKKLVGTVLRAATLILIAIIILLFLKTFLSNASTYGKILLLGQTKDTTLIAYLAVGGVLIGYELLNFFWAASRTHARSRNNNRLDTGRGLVSFIIIYAGACLSAMFGHLIPASPSWLTGVQGAISLYGGLKSTLLPLCAAGVISCIVRKIVVR